MPALALTNTAMHRVINSGAEDPFFIVDLNAAIQRVALWKALLPRVTPFYAVKCNPDTMLLAALAQQDVNFDCASRAEIQTVLDLGVSSRRIIYANPCKQPSHLRFAKDVGVALTVADSEAELHKTAAVHPRADLLLRIAVDDSQAACVMSCKYGAPMSDVPRLLHIAAELGLSVRGVSFHVGSGQPSAHAFVDAVDRAAHVFALAEAGGQHALDIVDIGGGFPGVDTPQLSFRMIAAALRPALDAHFPESRGVALIAEPGRFLAAASHTLAVNVIGKKRVAQADARDDEEKEHTMLFVNDGLYGSFNCVLYDHAEPTPHVLAPAKAAATQRCSIWGPTCDGLDCITKNAELPDDLPVGAWLYFPHMGAYSSAAGSNFNGMPLPEKTYLPLDGLSSVSDAAQPAPGAAALLQELAMVA